MEIQTGNTKDRGVDSILEIQTCDRFRIYVFPGVLSDNDIKIKFKDKDIAKSRLRTPTHIHWTVDLLIKYEHNPELTSELLRLFRDHWNEITPLNSRDFDSIKNKINFANNQEIIEQYSDLNGHGFFSVQFILTLMELLMIQEKTNMPDAYMFLRAINEFLKHQDLYKILSIANPNWRK